MWALPLKIWTFSNEGAGQRVLGTYAAARLWSRTPCRVTSGVETWREREREGEGNERERDIIMKEGERGRRGRRKVIMNSQEKE